MNLTRISTADLHALKSLRGSPEFKRLWNEEFASQCAVRRSKIAEMEKEEARLLAQQAECYKKVADAEERAKAARHEALRLEAETLRLTSEFHAASCGASGVRTQLERELRESAHPDIAELLRAAVDLGDRVRHQVRTSTNSLQRNVLGLVIPSIWSNADEIESAFGRVRAIEMELRGLLVAGYPETLIEVLRALYEEMAAIAKRCDVRLVKIETISGVDGGTS